MTGPNPILDGIGPIEGFARRAEHAFEHAFRHFEHPGDPEPVVAREHVIPAGEPLNSQAPAVQPVNLAAGEPAASTQEETPMSLASLKKDFEAIDGRVLDVVDAVQAHPETASILSDLGALAKIEGIPVGTIAQIGAGLKALLGLYAPEPVQAAAPPAPAQ